MYAHVNSGILNKSREINSENYVAVCKAKNHILLRGPYFTYFIIMVFNVLKQIMVISLSCWVKTYLNFIGIKERKHLLR